MIIRPSTLIRQLLLTSNPPICQTDPEKPWRCITTILPDGAGTLDDMVAIIDRDDQQISRYVSDSTYRLDPHILIVVRAVGLPRSYDKMREISDLLDSIHSEHITIGSDTYLLESTRRTSNVQLRGIDGTNRRYTHMLEYDLHFV